MGGGTGGAVNGVLFALVLLIQFRNKMYSRWEMGHFIQKIAIGVPNHKKACTD